MALTNCVNDEYSKLKAVVVGMEHPEDRPFS